MDQRLSNATSTLANAALKLCTVLANYWRTALADQEYRPELHYMRGPGPKWREAHASARKRLSGCSRLPTGGKSTTGWLSIRHRQQRHSCLESSTL